MNARRRGVIDTHAHLDALEEPADAVARAREAGVTRIITIGTGIDSCRRALELAESTTASTPRSASTRTRRRATRRAGSASCASCSRHESAVAVGETGLDYHYGADAARRAAAALRGAARARRRARTAGRDPHARRRRGHARALLRRHRGTVVMHCFSEPGLLGPALEHGWYVSFAGNVTYPKADELRAAAAAVPRDRILAETDSPYLAPQPVRGRAQRAGARRPHRRRARRGPRRGRRGAGGADRRATRRPPSGCRDRQRRRRSSASTSSPTRTSSASSAASPSSSPDDVVLEIGPGLGVLTGYLAERVRARPCRRARPLARAAAWHDLPRERPAALGRRARARPRGARARRRPSSSRTCPTTSPRRSSPRASTACRRSGSGA